MDLFSVEKQQEIFTLAKKHIDNGEFHIGEELLELVIESASRNNDVTSFIEAHLTCLKMKKACRRYDELHQHLIKVLPYLNYEIPFALKFEFQYLKASCDYLMGINNPISTLEELFAVSKEKQLFLDQAYITNQLIHIYIETNELDKAEQLVQEMSKHMMKLQHKPFITYMFLIYSFNVYLAKENIQQLKDIVKCIEDYHYFSNVKPVAYHYWACKAFLSIMEEDVIKAKSYFSKAYSMIEHRYYFLNELTLWVNYLKMRGLYKESVEYQKIMIELMKQKIETIDWNKRAEIISEMSVVSMKRSLYSDYMTSLLNRNYFEELLDSNRLYNDYTFAIIDINRLKLINDKYGRIVGDQAIRFIAKILLKWRDVYDIDIIRYGGDEFILICPYKLDELMQKFEDLLALILNTSFIIRGTNEKILLSLSIGVTAATEPTLLKDLLAKADKALYIAKNKGDNQIHIN